MKIKVLSDIMQANDNLAAVNRERFRKASVLALNLMSGPGAGKTTLIERTAAALAGELRIGVVEGDIATSRDAERLAKYDIPVVQINTGSECHLDANMVYGAIKDFPVEDIDILIIENVGNLVCPAEFVVGEHHKVMLLSTPEGDEKPLKYPLMFHESSLLLVNKVDLIPHTNFDLDAAHKNALQVSPNLKIIDISCTTGQGLDQWYDWLRIERKRASSA
jgi:hydrogenase nickel incorporation protein HypB